ncbi:GNAT family N-acetyltransferase [bacterium]|jgi:RimJ/RimL family protein N-acetyltransferase|nr:GNAT family N-acetyltransferase [bacterium]
MNPIETDRLILREFRKDDISHLVLLNQNEKVMNFFPATLNKNESLTFLLSILTSYQLRNFGLYACICKDTNQFMGFIGLSVPSFSSHFTPCIEIGWRLSPEFWNKGYATEGAKAILNYGFKELHLMEIVSFTSILNKPSIRVMEKIGMTTNKTDNFKHPKVDKKSKLSEHVLYRLSKKNFEQL